MGEIDYTKENEYENFSDENINFNVNIDDVSLDELISYEEDSVNFKKKKDYIEKILSHRELYFLDQPLICIGSDVEDEYSDAEINEIIMRNIEFSKSISSILFSEAEKELSFSESSIAIMYVTSALCYKSKLSLLGNPMCSDNPDVCRRNIAQYDKFLVQLIKSDSPLSKDASALLIFERYCFFYCHAKEFLKSTEDEVKSVYSLTDIINEVLIGYLKYIKEVFNPDKSSSTLSYFMLEMKKIFTKIRGNSKVVVINDNIVIANDKYKKAALTLNSLGITETNNIIIADFINLRNYCRNGHYGRKVSPIDIKYFNNFAQADARDSDFDIDASYGSDQNFEANIDKYRNPLSIYLKNEKDTLIEKTIRHSLTRLQSEVFMLYLQLLEEKREFARMKTVISRDFNLTPEQKAMAKKAVLKKESAVFKNGNTIEKEIATRFGIRVTDVKGWISDGMRAIRDSEAVNIYFGKGRLRNESTSFENGGIFDSLISGIEIKTW